MKVKSYHNLEIQNQPLQIGPYQLHSLSTASFGLDGGAMFGTVPKVLWERTNPADEQNRILLDCRCLLLVSPEKKILIDTGLGSDFVAKYGEKLGPKFAKMYAIEDEDSQENSKKTNSGIVKALAQKSFAPEDITDVILSHLHFDHTGGSTEWRNGKLQATFPKAQYYIQKSNFETAQKPNLREKASYYACNFMPLKESGQLQLLEGACELFPFISVELTDGHTQGQQNIIIEDDKNSLIYCADLIPTATHVRLPWVMGYDLNPLLLIEEKKRQLEKASAKNSFLFFEHDPYCDMAQIKKDEKRHDFRLKSIFNLS